MPTVDVLYPGLPSGEWAPDLHARRDLDGYARAASRLRNVLVKPSGALERRWGTSVLAEHPFILEEVDLSGATPTAPNFGTAANGIDGDETTEVETTNTIGLTSPYVVLHVDLGALGAVAALHADVVGLRIDAGTSEREFVVQWSTDNVVWNDMGPSKMYRVTPTATTRRFTGPATSPARYWRVARIGATDLGSAIAILSEFRLWTATTALSNAYLIDHVFSADQRYVHVLTDRNLQVWRDDVLQVHAPWPYTSAELAEIGYARALDTLITVHGSHAPHRARREGADDAWSARPYELKNVPTDPFERRTTCTGKPDATTGQELDWFCSPEMALLTYNTFAGSRVVEIVGGATSQGFKPGQKVRFTGNTGVFTVVEIDDVSVPKTITLDRACDANTGGTTGSGADFVASDVGKYLRGLVGYARITRFVNAGNVELFVEEPFLDAEARDPGDWKIEEPAWSDARGWPRTVAFIENRIVFGGTASLPQTLWAGRAFDFTDMRSYGGRESLGFAKTAATTDVQRTTHLVAADRLIMLTDARAFWLAKADGEALTDANAEIRETCRVAAKAGVRALRVGDAVLFVDADSGLLRALVPDRETGSGYRCENLSLLAHHLAVDPVDLVHAVAVTPEETDRVYVVNGDGTVAALSYLPEQNLAAWSLLVTAGTVLGACVVGSDVYLSVERTVGGVTKRFLEKADAGAFTDCGLRGTGAKTTVTGLDHLEGATVACIADGQFIGNAVVAGGAVTLDPPATTDWEVGLAWPDLSGAGDQVWIQALEPDFTAQGLSTLGKPKRVARVIADVQDTTGLWVHGFKVPFQALPVDSGAPPAPYTGTKRVESLRGWGRELATPITQREPARLTLRGFEMRVIYE